MLRFPLRPVLLARVWRCDECLRSDHSVLADCRYFPLVAAGLGSCLLQRRGEQWMLWGLEWIDHGHPSPCKSVLEVLAEQQPTLLIRSHRQDQRVPDRHLVIRREIERSAHRFKRGIGDVKRIRPTQNGNSRLLWRAA